MPEQVRELVSQAVERVLETMCFSMVMGPLEDSQAQPLLSLSAAVDFHGLSDGSVAIGCNPAGAHALAASFLGESDVTAQHVEQFVAELANMVCGAVVSALDGTGQFALDPPRPVAPDWLATAGGVRCDFEIEDGVLSVVARLQTCPEAACA